ncbi:transcriptional regulator, LysR family [Citreimonas salinaria]|uniref:Transcriptional regulator, LysR family n=1 Tax=Citreimonas salinaria TaxID=321339 RepID=A0A1H3IQS2_9RHOB|nr:transcriptional regulator, LysR family [Citreimonas salinaria]
MKFPQLRLLAALREHGQIGAAARSLGMTQPAASRLMAQLEAMVGTPLYVRHPRGVELTEAGRILAEQASETLKGLDRAYQTVSELKGGVRGQVRVGSVTGPSLEHLLPVLREVRLTYPDIEVTVQVDTSDRLAEALLADDLDFYIGRIPDMADARPFAVDVIGPEPISLLVRLDHPLTRKEQPTLADCLAFDWILQPPGGLLRRTAENHLLERGLPMPPRVVSTTSMLFTLALVNDTNAIAPIAHAVSQFFIQRAALGSRLAILPVAESIAVRDFGIVSRADTTHPPATDRFLSLLRARTRSARARAENSR